MKVSEYIIKFGIENLKGLKIQHNGKIYCIVVSPDDEYTHSLQYPAWKKSKSRLDRYHRSGNYRFCAVDDNMMSVWVNPSTEIVSEKHIQDHGFHNTVYGFIVIKEFDGEIKIDYNYSIFNSTEDMLGFLRDTKLQGQLLDTYC